MSVLLCCNVVKRMNIYKCSQIEHKDLEKQKLYAIFLLQYEPKRNRDYITIKSKTQRDDDLLCALRIKSSSKNIFMLLSLCLLVLILRYSILNNNTASFTPKMSERNKKIENEVE